jgi:hypothetical protein
MTDAATTNAILPGSAPDLPALKAFWLRHLRAANLSPKTIRGYSEAVDLFDGYLAAHGMPRVVANIRREHCFAPRPPDSASRGNGPVWHESSSRAPCQVFVALCGGLSPTWRRHQQARRARGVPSVPRG